MANVHALGAPFKPRRVSDLICHEDNANATLVNEEGGQTRIRHDVKEIAGKNESIKFAVKVAGCGCNDYNKDRCDNKCSEDARKDCRQVRLHAVKNDERKRDSPRVDSSKVQIEDSRGDAQQQEFVDGKEKSYST